MKTIRKKKIEKYLAVIVSMLFCVGIIDVSGFTMQNTVYARGSQVNQLENLDTNAFKQKPVEKIAGPKDTIYLPAQVIKESPVGTVAEISEPKEDPPAEEDSEPTQSAIDSSNSKKKAVTTKEELNEGSEEKAETKEAKDAVVVTEESKEEVVVRVDTSEKAEVVDEEKVDSEEEETVEESEEAIVVYDPYESEQQIPSMTEDGKENIQTSTEEVINEPTDNEMITTSLVLNESSLSSEINKMEQINEIEPVDTSSEMVAVLESGGWKIEQPMVKLTNEELNEAIDVKEEYESITNEATIITVSDTEEVIPNTIMSSDYDKKDTRMTLGEESVSIVDPLIDSQGTIDTMASDTNMDTLESQIDSDAITNTETQVTLIEESKMGKMESATYEGMVMTNEDAIGMVNPTVTFIDSLRDRLIKEGASELLPDGYVVEEQDDFYIVTSVDTTQIENYETDVLGTVDTIFMDVETTQYIDTTLSSVLYDSEGRIVYAEVRDANDEIVEVRVYQYDDTHNTYVLYKFTEEGQEFSYIKGVLLDNADLTIYNSDGQFAQVVLEKGEDPNDGSVPNSTGEPEAGDEDTKPRDIGDLQAGESGEQDTTNTDGSENPDERDVEYKIPLNKIVASVFDPNTGNITNYEAKKTDAVHDDADSAVLLKKTTFNKAGDEVKEELFLIEFVDGARNVYVMRYGQWYLLYSYLYDELNGLWTKTSYEYNADGVLEKSVMSAYDRYMKQVYSRETFFNVIQSNNGEGLLVVDYILELVNGKHTYIDYVYDDGKLKNLDVFKYNYDAHVIGDLIKKVFLELSYNMAENKHLKKIITVLMATEGLNQREGEYAISDVKSNQLMKIVHFTLDENTGEKKPAKETEFEAFINKDNKRDIRIKSIIEHNKAENRNYYTYFYYSEENPSKIEFVAISPNEHEVNNINRAISLTTSVLSQEVIIHVYDQMHNRINFTLSVNNEGRKLFTFYAYNEYGTIEYTAASIDKDNAELVSKMGQLMEGVTIDVYDKATGKVVESRTLENGCVQYTKYQYAEDVVWAFVSDERDVALATNFDQNKLTHSLGWNETLTKYIYKSTHEKTKQKVIDAMYAKNENRELVKSDFEYFPEPNSINKFLIKQVTQTNLATGEKIYMRYETYLNEYGLLDSDLAYYAMPYTSEVK